jgi:hypothetical protein
MMASALGLVEVATPIRGSALAAVDCIAHKTITSNAGVHLWLYMAHLTLRLFISFQFRFELAIKTTLLSICI